MRRRRPGKRCLAWLAVAFALAAAARPLAAGEAAQGAGGEGAAERHAAAAGAPPAAAGSAETAAGHGAAAPHDPFDLSEANPSPQLDDPVAWNRELAFCTLIVFLGVLAVLWRYAWGPIMAGLARRERAIAARIEDAQRSAEEAAAQLQAYREKMAAAGAEAQELIAKARREGESLAETIRHRAQQDALGERQRAVAEIDAAKHAALREVAQRGADLAVTLAGRIVQRELRPEEHLRLIADAIESFPSKN